MTNGDRVEDEGLPWAEDSPFTRDLDGFLVRTDEPTLQELAAPVRELVIDGVPVEKLLREPVMRAVPQTDELGHPVHRDGLLVPRATTIFDVLSAVAREQGEPNRVPVLCHQPHLRPVAVCRVCSVLLMRKTDRRPPRKLFPACQHRVEDGMCVHTVASREKIEWGGQKGRVAGDVVASMARLLAELLVTDHLPRYDPGTAHRANELWTVARRLGTPAPGRFPLPLAPKAPPGREPRDESSDFIRVDHAACILCDRCVRGCTDVRKNDVIGRTGKGYETRVGFDLDDPMGGSSCVTCGECAVWCPTDALTIRRPVEIPPDPHIGGRIVEADRPGGPRAVTVAELRAHPLFARLPQRLLVWLQEGIVRRELGVSEVSGELVGDVLYREGEYGSSSFLLEKGTLLVEIRSPIGAIRAVRHGRTWWARRRGRSVLQRLSRGPSGAAGRGVSVRTDAGVSFAAGEQSFPLTAPVDGTVRLIGETACLNNYPYGSTVSAIESSVVLEIRRNVLLALLRNPESREIINRSFRETALEECVARAPAFAGLTNPERASLAADLRTEARFVRAAPGQVIATCGEEVRECALVRVGFVRLTVRHPDGVRHDYVGPGGLLGADELAAGTATAIHTADATALDHVELVLFPADHIRRAVRRSAATAPRPAPPDPSPSELAPDRSLQAFLDQGLFQAQRLLVLDLNKCTRCDECTKACADTHGGVTRLIREGLRFEHFLVATSCRSCLDPVYMVGCPVDAIHRHGGPEIRIADHCIGCGLCEKSCPYGNINMTPLPDAPEALRAVTCDLCQDVVGENEEPSCVYACPHDAAHRINGEELRRRTRQ